MNLKMVNHGDAMLAKIKITFNNPNVVILNPPDNIDVNETKEITLEYLPKEKETVRPQISIDGVYYI